MGREAKGRETHAGWPKILPKLPPHQDDLDLAVGEVLCRPSVQRAVFRDLVGHLVREDEDRGVIRDFEPCLYVREVEA